MFNNKKQFKIDCRVINIQFEYENFKGKEKYIIASKLSEDEIRMIYPEEAKRYSPFVKVDLEFCEIRQQFKSNDEKHNQRLTKSIEICRYGDSGNELSHIYPQLCVKDFTLDMVDEEEKQTEIRLLYEALETLTPLQKERVILYFFHGVSKKEIAELSNSSPSSIRDSLDLGIKKIKKYFETYRQIGL